MEPYLFRQMLLEHIIPEIQSEKNSLIVMLDPEESTDEEYDKQKESEAEEDEEDLDNHSLNSEDMAVVPKSSLVAVNEKRVKFAWANFDIPIPVLWLLVF